MKDENGNEIVETPVEPTAEESLEHEVNDLYDDTPEEPIEEPPAEEPPSEEPPAENPPPSEEPPVPPAEEPPAEEPPSEEPPAEEPPASEEPPPADGDELSQLKEQNVKLLKLIEDGASPKAPTEEPPAAPAAEEPPTPPAPPAHVEGMEEFLEGMDFDAVMESKENFKAFMLKITSGVQERTRQSVLTSIPEIMGNYVQRKAAMDKVGNAFYKDFPELKRSKRFVASVANDVTAKNPDWTIKQVMDETGKQAMDTLGLKKQVVEKEKEGASKPKPKAQLPGSSSTKNPLPPPSGLADEIADLYDD